MSVTLAMPPELAGTLGPTGDYAVPWFDAELTRLEALRPASDDERYAIVERVDDMETVIADHVDEDEPAFAAAYETVADASPRLTALRATHEHPSDAARLRIPPRADRLLPAPTVPGFGEPQPLAAYLDRLASVTFDDVPLGVADAPEWAAWRDATAEILADQVAFADAVVDRRPDGVVPLLRDGLPYHLVARRRGIASAAVPLGRSYLYRFGAGYGLYDQITGALYDAVREHPTEPAAMWDEAVRALRARIADHAGLAEAADGLRREAGPALPDGDLVVLETGLQGTMPLMFAAVFPQATAPAMYAAGPYLEDAFGDRVFRRYSALRPAETLTCTDRLFQMAFDPSTGSGRRGDAWLIREALDPLTRAFALWEVATVNASV